VFLPRMVPVPDCCLPTFYQLRGRRRLGNFGRVRTRIVDNYFAFVLVRNVVKAITCPNLIGPRPGVATALKLITPARPPTRSICLQPIEAIPGVGRSALAKPDPALCDAIIVRKQTPAGTRLWIYIGGPGQRPCRGGSRDGIIFKPGSRWYWFRLSFRRIWHWYLGVRLQSEPRPRNQEFLTEFLLRGRGQYVRYRQTGSDWLFLSIHGLQH
jgi:hypothetical protein